MTNDTDSGVAQRLCRALPLLLVVLASAAAQWSILGNYFYEDDFMHFYQIANYGFLAFLVFSQGGHFYLVRNFLFWAMHAAFGVEPMPYFAVALATHLVNAALLYLVLARQSRDRWLAAAVAAMWGTCLASRGTIGWYSVYGHALTATALLAALLMLPAGRAPASWRRLLAVAAAIATGAMCFGDGLAVGMAFWAIALLHLEDAASRKRGLVVFGGLALLLPVLYVLYLGAGPFVFGQALPGASPVASVSYLTDGVRSLTLLKIQMVGYLASAGIGALVLGGVASQAQVLPVNPLTLPVAVVVVGIACWFSDAAGRRRIAGWLVVVLAAYAMIAIGRTVFCLISNTPLVSGAGAPRYHYLAQVGVAALFVGWFSDGSVDGRRVYFVEPNVQ